MQLPLPNYFKNCFSSLIAGVVVSSMLQIPTPVLSQQQVIAIQNQVSYTYSDSPNGDLIGGTSLPVVNNVEPLVDPLGKITGCNGELLDDYTGFSIAIYEADPSDPTGTTVRGLVPLTTTELPDKPDNNISLGLAPNAENNNPFFFSNGLEGAYNFLFDAEKGQLDPGRTYIFVITPPANSIYQQRRIKITINSRNGSQVSYTATSLDGKPISNTDDLTTQTETVNIRDAARIGLVLAFLDFDASICQSQEIQIIKTGDRASAEPGDTVIYRISFKNLASAGINNVTITDTLPLGFNFLPNSVRGELANNSVEINSSHNGSTISFKTSAVISTGEVLNIAYAAQLTADAIRGTGQNSAIATGQRLDNGQIAKDGPATHRLRIAPGILSDCGTLIGRVFVDKNFDGEQQPGEPGVPNAVVFLDGGNRITTDPNGLFSVAEVISGYRTGVLDLSSLPGYTLAPNQKFSERNSQSRLVHLEPGGLVRMNFAVTPTFREAKP